MMNKKDSDMIIWTGICQGMPAYRVLGDKNVMKIPEIETVKDQLSHNEGTTTENGTSPSLGTGNTKLMRDYSSVGYTAGVHIQDPSKDPTIISRDYCVMAYDLECEWGGHATSNIQTPILCGSLYCTCGYNITLTRCSLTAGIPHEVVTCNSQMATRLISLIMNHAPIFTLGHNVYEFDNMRLACSLPIDSSYREYFVPTSDSIGKAVSNAGFVMCIPGINNLDTLRYMRKAMPQKFKSFALGSLATELDLPSKKLNTEHMRFSLEWYNKATSNAVNMVKYNLTDCQVNLDLCFNQDLLNQIVALCKITKSYIMDVMIYSTGAMAASSLVSYAYKRGSRYVWTRSDNHPFEFPGGYVHFKVPLVCSNPMIIDYNSMYPSIMIFGNISPESIDFMDKTALRNKRHTYVLSCMYYMYKQSTLYIGLTAYGANEVASNGCFSTTLLAKFCDKITSQSSSWDPIVAKQCARNTCKLVLESWKERSYGNKKAKWTCKDIRSNFCFYSSEPMPYKDPPIKDFMISQVKQMVEYCVITSRCYNNIWIPDDYEFKQYAVDWEVSPLGTELIVLMPDTICKHTLGTNVASNVCSNLMKERKEVKKKMKLLSRDTSLVRSEDIKVLDNLQWALKIAANSLYGCLAFTEYNTYSQRCGRSVTMCGRWALHVSIGIVQSLGCVVVYGDTDSVMYIIPRQSMVSHSNCLLPSYIQAMEHEFHFYDRTDILEYICGSREYNGFGNNHYYKLNGCITNIINHIISYTCLSGLSIETQETTVQTINCNDTYVFNRMMVLSSKHYVAKDNTGAYYSKGMSYVRRTGSNIQNLCARRFSSVALSTSDATEVISELRAEYYKMIKQVRHGTETDFFRIRATKNAQTKDYVKIITSGSRQSATEYAEFGDYDGEELDIGYYINIVDSCIESVCKAIGLKDATLVKTPLRSYSASKKVSFSSDLFS